MIRTRCLSLAVLAVASLRAPAAAPAGLLALQADPAAELEALLAEERADADRSRRLGDVRAAQRTLAEHLDDDPLDAWSRALSALCWRDRGEHARALDEIRAAAAQAAGGPREVQALCARVEAALLLERGSGPEALALLEGAAGALQPRTDARDGWVLGQALLAAGRRPEALEAWRGASEGEAATHWERALARARCERALGFLERASRSLVEADRLAAAGLGREPEVLVELGAVYFEADGEVEHPEARGRSPALLYEEALELAPDHERALLELFRLNRFNWNRSSRPAHEVLDELLAKHPASIEGLIAAASSSLDDGQLVAVRERLVQLEGLAPARREVRTLAAALAWVEHRREDCRAIQDELAATDPVDARPAREIARHLCELYRFAEALDFGAEAVGRDPADAEAWTQHGRALANTGLEDHARKAFERAIELSAGRQNAWRHNTAMVLERMAQQYVVVQGAGELSYAWQAPAGDVLAIYLLPFYEAARAELAERYGFTPGAVRIEVFGRHQDFSVRSTGFEGFPALGVCFGPVVTAVSPLAPELRGTFSWARTAFHEFSHVVHLGLSHNRCPRWITEGLATWEEESRNPSWTRNMRREVVDELANGSIIPVRELNRAFRGPRILFGYYQGGLLCRMLIEERGFPPMIRLLEAFDRGLDLDQALELVFDRTPEELDRQFDAWLRQWTAGLSIEPRRSREVVARLRLRLELEPPADEAARARWAEDWCSVAWGAWQAGVAVDAEEALRRVERAGLRPPRAHFLRGEIALARGDRAAAQSAWTAGFELGGEDFRARMGLGRLLLDAGDLAGAEQQFAAAERDFPGFDEPELSAELHLAQVYAHQGRTEEQFQARERWLAWESDDYPLRLQVARWHAQAGRHARAAELFREANEIDPFHRELHLDWGRSLLALADHAAALREFDVALAMPGELDPDLPGELPSDLAAELGGLRAAALAGLGRTEEAAEAARAALELDPACAAARSALESL
jgi:tetratricopeptide (TPR) repeat protein